MSKNAQRRNGAYSQGYRFGRYGLWDGQSPYYRGNFECVRVAGRRDRWAAMSGIAYPKKRTFWQKLKYIFGFGA